MPSITTAPEPLLSFSETAKQYPRALTADDLADLLQVSRLTVLRKAKRGVIPASALYDKGELTYSECVEIGVGA